MAVTTEWLGRVLQALDHDATAYTFDPNRLEFADEVESFRTILAAAADERALIPGTSRWSWRKLREDLEWLRQVDVRSPTAADVERLERISIRFQCLLADYNGCFMF